MDNPYEDLLSDDIHRISGRVSKQDYERIFNSCPRKGIQNAILSNLWFAFAKAVEEAGIEPIPLPENEKKLNEILTSISFKIPSKPSNNGRTKDRSSNDCRTSEEESEEESRSKES